jgi:hypothetical protein
VDKEFIKEELARYKKYLENRTEEKRQEQLLNIELFNDLIVFGEQAVKIDDNGVQRIPPNSKEYEQYIAGYDPYDETDEPSRCAIFKDGKVVRYE